MRRCNDAQIVRRNKDLVRRKRNAAGILRLFEALFAGAKNFWCASSQNFRLIQNENGRIGIIEERRFQRLNERHQIRRAGKQLAVIGEDQFLVQVFFKRASSVVPSAVAHGAPVAKHFPADHDVLHGQNVDALHRTA